MDGEIESAFYQELGRKLELRRKSQGMTQSDLGIEIGVHRNYIYRWEAGISAIPLWELMRVSSVLHCDFRTLLPSRNYTWGAYAEVWREAIPKGHKKPVQSERDPFISTDGLSRTERIMQLASMVGAA